MKEHDERSKSMMFSRQNTQTRKIFGLGTVFKWPPLYAFQHFAGCSEKISCCIPLLDDVYMIELV